ncbi:unnamed protein product [Rhizopus stolonifer]
MSSVIFKTITRRIHPTRTLTDYQVFTATVTATATSTQRIQSPLKEWEQQVKSNMPLVLVFVLIGVIALIALFCYLSFKLCRSNKKRFSPSDTEKGKDELPYALPWISDNNAYRKTTDMPNISKHLTPSIPQEEPVLPVHTSLNLVPRSEIMNDPARRRGVDEVDLWERKQSIKEQASSAALWKFATTRAYPDSPESVKRELSTQSAQELVSLNPTVSEVNTHDSESIKLGLPKNVQSAPNGLEEVKNNQWLQFTGSKSF